MKKHLSSILALLAVLAVLPVMSQALTMKVEDWDSTGLFNTVEFNVSLTDDAGVPMNNGEWFTAFCVDYYQPISKGTTVSTSVQPADFRDGLGLQTAWLFENYYPTDASNLQIAALQLAIWNVTDGYSLGGTSQAKVLANSYVSALNSNFGSADLDYLNRTYTIFTSGTKQDLIVKTGDPGSPVPEPSTVLLLSAGLLGIVGFGRKKASK